ncbi:MAG: lipase family alpha/beta hydrolase [Novosphingobium sp.]
MTPPVRRPSVTRLLRELLEVPQVALAPLRGAAEVPVTGHGEPVLVIPGFMADDASTSVLRKSLTAAGYQAFGWRLGFNRGFRENLTEQLVARMEEVHSRCGGQKIVLLGWSLGGLYARELGRLRPELVRLVMTMGSPFSGDMHANHAWRIYEAINDHKVTEIPGGIDFRAKPPVRTVALWSRLDGVVLPESSSGASDEVDERVELAVTHMGFAASKPAVAQVIAVLARELA